jgi:hypothetical protein
MSTSDHSATPVEDALGAQPDPLSTSPVTMMNPWLAYCQTTRPAVQHLDPQQQLRVMGIMWKALSEDQKMPYRHFPKAVLGVAEFKLPA